MAELTFLVKFVFCAAILLSASIECNEYEEIGIYPLVKHSLKKPFSYEWESNTIVNNVNWELIGNALAHRDFIRLTEDQKQNQVGGVWNTVFSTTLTFYTRQQMKPLKLWNWEIQIDFNISGIGKVYGDGLAIWYVRQPLQQGASTLPRCQPGGHSDHSRKGVPYCRFAHSLPVTSDQGGFALPGHVFGNADFFTGLGIFLDTYPNKYHGYQFPYLSAMANNGSHSFSMDNDGKPSELTGCHAALRNSTGRTSISIQYYDGLLKVRTDVEQRNRWSLCFASRIHLPTGYYIGITASTNYLSDNHDILELRTYRIDGHPPTSRDDNSVMIVMPKGSSVQVSSSLSLAVLCAAILYFSSF